MQVHYGLQHLMLHNRSVLTVGSFDGVHIAHQKILSLLHAEAGKHKADSVLVTFEPHPRLVLQHAPDFKILSTLTEKIKLLEKTTLNHLVVVNFTEEFSQLTPEAYIEKVLIEKLKVKSIVIGYNHHFGVNRSGNIHTLKNYSELHDFEIIELQKQLIEEESISSTHIRESLQNDDLLSANQMLKHPYLLIGRVIKGKQLGRTIGYPTANITIENNYKLLPSFGVYAVKVLIRNETKLGMLNIGKNPTIENNGLHIETHIFDFNETIYDEELAICFIEKIRNEIKFENIEALTNQLHNDNVFALKILNHYM